MHLLTHVARGVPLSQQGHIVAFRVSPSFSPFSSAAVWRQQMSWAMLSWAAPDLHCDFSVLERSKSFFKVENAHSAFSNQKGMSNSNQVCASGEAIQRHISLCSGVEAFSISVLVRLAHCYRDVIFQRASFHLQFFSQTLELILFFVLFLTPNLCSCSLSLSWQN